MFYKTSPILLLLSITIAISEQHSCPNATAKEKHENAFELIAKENSKYEKFKDDRLFEIDMKRPKVLRTDGDSGAPGEAARRNKYFFWKDGIIPYTFGPTLRQQKDYIKKVEDAMKEFHENTCLRFKKRDREADYVEIVYGNGCMSDVGKIGGKQQTSLGSGCYRHGIIVHELGHVAGFQHEQNRPDREQYVKVLYDNIQNKFKYAFNMFDDRAIDSRGVPYDYQSVMHYGGYDFSKNGKPTIKSLNHRVTFFGNNQLSPLDIKQLNLMYQCGGKIPDFPGDFKWRTNGRSDDEICTLITDDREPSSTGWDDNFLCQRKDNRDLKIRWSQNGPLRNMRCTKVTFPHKNNKKNSWSNSYLCVPTNGFYNFTWSTNGPLKGLQCLAITEPQDPYMKGKNFHLCAKSRKTDGQWSNWAPWPQCSKPCGGGLHTRTRSCDNPRPAFGGKYCRGESSETRRCNRHVCSTWPSFPADFEYRTYNSMPYDKTCVRTYERLDYLYWNNYFLCVTSGKRNLNMRWSDSGHQPNMKCVTIEEPGESWRWNDNCLCLPKDSPYEFKWSYNGKIPGLPCLKWEARGGAQGWDNNYLCASKLPNSSGSVGRWSAWSAWGTCSKTCGIGIQERRRTCSNAPCSGSSNETRVCNKKKCAGRWSKWSGWGSCSKTCGTGIQKRRRTCFKPPCTGLGNEVKLCKRKDCERWSRWSAWSRCSKTCGSGYQRRDRTCSGAPCTGSKRQTRVCNRKACDPPVGRWSKWSAWSRCSKTCGTGNQRRDRTCSRAPCTGSRTEARVCKMKDCERWSRWSAWSGCSKTCGTGYQRRDRTCSGAPCTGSKRQTRVCNRKACERWSRWSAWNKCSKTCGTGYQRRYRTCSGAPCTASKRQTRFCKMRNCKRTCGGTLTADSGVLSSIANPKNMICVWFIEVSRAKFIDLTFVNLDLSTSRRCRNNYVELRKYTSYNSVRGISFGRKCGKTNGNIFHARTNKMRIKLKATNNRGKGFKISWTTKVANMNAKAFKG